MAAHPEFVEQFRSGKEGVIDALVGQVMKRTQGRADAGGCRSSCASACETRDRDRRGGRRSGLRGRGDRSRHRAGRAVGHRLYRSGDVDRHVSAQVAVDRSDRGLRRGAWRQTLYVETSNTAPAGNPLSGNAGPVDRSRACAGNHGGGVVPAIAPARRDPTCADPGRGRLRSPKGGALDSSRSISRLRWSPTR